MRSEQLRVGTYNIHHGADGRDRLDLRRTAAAISALRADVVGLQEVDVAYGERSGFEDQAARLAELLGMQVRFTPAIDKAPVAPGEERRRYGLALLSWPEIIAHRTDLLPGHPGLGPLHEPRALLTATVRPPGQEPLDVMVTHLDHEEPGHRIAQVLRILEHADALEHSAVLVGDLNADPAAAELSPLAASGWQEAAAGITGAAPRSSLAAMLSAAVPLGRGAGRATFPSRLPLRRIDSVWTRGALEATALEVGTSHASDHRPLVATLRRVPDAA